MVPLHITPRRVAPYLLGGASGVHILARMWRLSRLPTSKGPLHLFLLKHSDVILVLSSGPVIIWHLAQRQQRRITDSRPTENNATQTIIPQIVHQLRQVFTALLLGLGVIKRKVTANQIGDIPRLANRLQKIVAEGIQAVNMLDPPDTGTGNEWERARGA